MDAVLGLSVTPSAVGLVLVQGQDADAATMDVAGFAVDGCGSSTALQTSEQAAAAVLRTEAIAAGRGQRVRSIGVTWSDAADAEASLLLKSLNDSGFDNIVPVRLSEATDALARGIAELTEFRTTAVCVIEPEQLIALVVQTDERAVQTAVNHTVVTEDDLVGWLSAVFTQADWQPEALVLVGSAEDLDGLRPVLQEALSVPVFSPAAAQLALARGAALACAQNSDSAFGGVVSDVSAEAEQPMTVERRVRRLAPVGAASILAAGVLTFVASASAALALQATPERSAPLARPAAEASVQTPVAVRRPAPATLPQAAPAPEAAPPPAPEAGPPAELIAPETPGADGIPPQPELAAALPPLDAPQVPAAATPAVSAPEAVPPPEAEGSPTIRQRIRQRLTTFGDETIGDEEQLADIPPPLP